MKQGSLFCYFDISQALTMLDVVFLVSLEASISRGAPTWFETIWNYSVEVIDYWIIFSMKIK
jgi:hypothetical protein